MILCGTGCSLTLTALYTILNSVIVLRQVLLLVQAKSPEHIHLPVLVLHACIAQVAPHLLSKLACFLPVTLSFC